jgi:transcriptional regulator GlxA family with amidase domain
MQTRSRSLAVLLFDEVELFDVASLLSVVSVAGRHWNWRPFKVEAVAENPGSIATRDQIAIVAPRRLDEVPAPEFVFIPGGYGARKALTRPAIIDWLSKASASAELVLASGNGVLLLAKSGVLGDQRVAARAEIEADLRELAPSVSVDSALTESGKLLTASSSGQALELALRLVSRVLGPKLANGAAQTLGVPWLTPETAGVKAPT